MGSISFLALLRVVKKAGAAISRARLPLRIAGSVVVFA